MSVPEYLIILLRGLREANGRIDLGETVSHLYKGDQTKKSMPHRSKTTFIGTSVVRQS